jgi:hypothetical protein
MRREWEPEELIACWALVEDDWRLVSNKAGATRLASASRATLRRRLLLVLFGLGTNMGVRRGVAAGEDEHGETEAMLRRVRRLYVNRDNLRRAITRLVNATFEARDRALWGQGTACASDSKKFGSWQSNLRNPLLDGLLLALDGAAHRALHAPAHALLQDRPQVSHVIAHPGAPPPGRCAEGSTPGR